MSFVAKPNLQKLLMDLAKGRIAVILSLFLPFLPFWIIKLDVLWLVHDYSWKIAYPAYALLVYGVSSFLIDLWDSPWVRSITGRLEHPLLELAHYYNVGKSLLEWLDTLDSEEEGTLEIIDESITRWFDAVGNWMAMVSLSSSILWRTNPLNRLERVASGSIGNVRLAITSRLNILEDFIKTNEQDKLG
jgi:hypothetical protein